MSAGNALEGVRVLVAEDEALIALDLETTLRGLGCAVVGPTPTVADTLALLANERPDAVLLDLDLMDGWSEPVAEALDAAGVPFVLMTGYQQDELDAPVLRDAPCLAKPFDPESLRSVLLDLLGALPTPSPGSGGR
jgi:CheY-like chemotaxis protein